MAKQQSPAKYIAIIMDGNGRWAKQRGLRRTEGHKKGAANVKNVVRIASELGVKELVLYTFSTENWRRAPSEVKFLMNLLEKQVIEQREEIMEQNIRFNTIGDISKLPIAVQKELETTTQLSKKNSGMRAILALNYGGRQEILDAVKKICAEKKPKKHITEKQFRKYMYDPSLHDPDLLIRTGGDMRVSNFLLWQISYSELYFCDTLWPDFGKTQLVKAINNYKRRNRRYGGL